MQLIRPQTGYEDSWSDAMRQLAEDGLPVFWKTHPERISSIHAYIAYIEERRTALLHQRYELWWLEDQGRIIGYLKCKYVLTMERYHRGGQLSYGVIPDARGRGAGTFLCQQAQRLFQEQGYEECMTLVEAHNIPSIKVLEKQGARVTEIFDRKGIQVLRYWLPVV